ncbi:MAG: PKD domain-containing protein [Ruminococcaceae bacterium]|nr:PKD domain-containing protein [Oscillospiraceae bacterium]
MKITNRIFSAGLAAVILLSSVPMNIFAVTEVEDMSGQTAVENTTQSSSQSASGYKYTLLEDGTVCIDGYEAADGAAVAHLTIPATLDGMTVTQLSEEAFAFQTELETVVLPSTITAVGNSAFYHCESLKAIAFEGKAPKFGFTIAEGCAALEKVFCLTDCDLSAFCALLVSDLGERVATGVEISAFADLTSLQAAYKAYLTDAPGQIDGSIQSAVTVIGDIVAEGTCGDTIVWQLDSNGVLAITGSGAMPDYQSKKSPWYANRGNIRSLVLGKDITRIGSYAFQDCAGIKTLTLHSGLASIGNYAFYNCDGIMGGLTIPASVSSIGTYAFYDCDGFDGKLIIEANDGMTIGERAFYSCGGFTGLELGDGVTSIGYYAFYECAGMTGDLVIPDSVTSIGSSAFQNCKGFDGSLTLSENLATIESSVFSNCSKITGELVIPDSVTRLNSGAFGSMDGITSVIIGANVTYTNYPFSNCDSLKEMTFTGTTVPDNNPFSGIGKALEKVYVPTESYEAYASDYKTYLPAGARLGVIDAEDDFLVSDDVLTAYLGEGGEVVIPDGVKTIGVGAFRNCTTLTKVILPDSVETIDEYAFSGCANLVSVEFSDSLTTIGNYAFQNCNSLEAVVLPDSLEIIGDYAFYNCDGITGGLTIPASVFSIGTYAFYDCDGFDGKLIIEANYGMTIGERAFYSCGGFTGLELGDGVTSIDYYAFYECAGMTGDLVIPDSVESIGSSAFQNCKGFDGSLTLSENLATIESYVFSNCSKITGELVIPDSVTRLNSGAFGSMDGITSVIIGENVTYTNYPFSNCDSLKEMTFTGTTVPSNNPFSGVGKALEKVYVPAESYEVYVEAYKTYVPANAQFRAIGAEGEFLIDGDVLTAYFGQGGEVEIPDGVKTIGMSAFRNCTTLTKVILPDSVETIDEYAFSGCANLVSVEFSDSLTTIGNYAFQNCNSLEAVVLPDSLEIIGDYAFYNCDGITGGLTIPASVSSIGTDAFYDCDGFDGKLIIEANDGMTIGERAFYSCGGFTGLELGDGVTSIDYYAFYECAGMTGDLVIPNSVASIGAYAFHNCKGFDGTLTLSENLTVIESHVFYGCSKITGELVIPDSVTSLEYYAFGNMDGITAVIIGANVTYVYYTFNSCDGIKEMTFTGTTVPDNNPFSGIGKALEKVYVPAESYEAYVEAYKTYVPANAQLSVIGAEGEFLIDGDVLTAYFGQGGEVEIPDGVKTIGMGAFRNCTTLTKVTLPDSVETIDEYAFSGCANLVSVEFSDSLTTIGNYAFSSCVSLLSMDLPGSLVTIGERAFETCAALTSLHLPSNLETIGNYAFYNCDGITGGLTIPASVSSIGQEAFYDCDGFDGKLVIQANDGMIIGEGAFQYCGGFTGLELGDGVTSIDYYAFYECAGMTGDLVIPDSVTSIGSSAFQNCKGFDGTLTLSENLTDIESYVFYGCSKITGELVIPDSVTSLEYYAFGNMDGITAVIIGANVTYVYYTFNGCDGIKEMTFTGITVPYDNPFFGVGKTLEAVYVPAESYEAYASDYKTYLPAGARLGVIDAEDDFLVSDDVLTAYLGEGGEVVIPDGVKTIGTGAFRNCTTLTKVILPDSVEIIDEYAFSGCTGLVSVEFSHSLTTIGSYAFQNCSSLEALDLPDCLTDIEAYGFYECKALKSLTLPSSLKKIGEYAFANCDGITGGLTIPGSVSSIGNYAFLRCNGFDGKLVIERNDGMTIGEGVFQYCSGFTGLEIGEGVTSIGTFAFYDCHSMTGDLVIPDSVTSMGSSVFSNCNSFDGTLTISQNLRTIGSYTFSDCSHISGELVIPKKITEIGYLAFGNMDGITSVIIGEQVASVSTPFRNCDNIKEMTFMGTSVPENNPFSGIGKALESVYVPKESYDKYVSAYSDYVGENVQFATDLLKAQVKNLAISQLYSRTVVLTWMAHISEEVVGYVIKRDGVVVADTTGLTYVDRTLSVDTAYVYTIYGYTEDGRTTSESTITVTPVAPTIMNIKTDNGLNKIGVNGGRIYAYVYNDKNLEPFGDEKTVGNLYYVKDGTRVLIGQATLSTALGSSSTAVYTVDWDITNVEDGDYPVVFVLKDVDGATTEYSETLSVDRSVPEKISQVMAVGNVDVIYVNWVIATEIDTIYRIYRRSNDSESFTMIAQISDRNTLSYTDKAVDPNKVYYYYVVGVNDFGQESEPSDIAAASLRADTEAPVVTKLTPDNGSYLSGSVIIGVTSQDNLAVTQTQLYYSLDDGETWILLDQSVKGSFTSVFDTTTLPDGPIKVKGMAYDAAGNESTPMIYVFCVDNTGPEQVKGLAYESTSVTVTLRWNDVADQDMGYYCVEIKNADDSYDEVVQADSTLGVNIYHLTPDTEYTYRVVGYDVHGNRGIPSEDITVRTKSDTTPPVISKIRPTSGYYADTISLSITATDEYSIKSILIQTSVNGSKWVDVYTETYDQIGSVRTLYYDLSVASYPEGHIYIRAIATDHLGNQSVSDKTAPFVQHIIDRTPPKQPENLIAIGYSGYIEISWTQGSETDLNRYAVYRATEENGKFVLLAGGIAALNYYDRNVTPGTTYFYKITVDDLAGNQSEYSEVVSASVLSDTEKPEIHSIYPAASHKIGLKHKTISVLAGDNHALASILIEYSKDGVVYHTLKVFENIDAYSKTVSADLDTAEFSHGDSVFIRVTVTDAFGNTAISDVVEYGVDFDPPTASSAEATFEKGAVTLEWIGHGEEDLAGYYVYRKVKGAGSYSLIAQRQAIADQTVYSIADTTLAKKGITYVYKIEATDQWGNTSYLETEITLPDRSAPVAKLSCEAVMVVGVEYYVDASLSTDDSAIVSYHIDFGDGTTGTESKAIHKYAATGTYTVTLTVTDDSGNVSSCTKEISVKERALLGSVEIQVKDENGKAVPNAAVYFDLGESSQVIKYTDNRGYASFTSEVGKHTVGCIIPNNEWLPAKKEIVVTAGEETVVTMTMIHQPLVEGSFEIHRMTFEEIVAAGIDVTVPENQYYVRVTVYLQYVETTIESPILWNPHTNEQKSEPIVVGDKVYIAKAVGGQMREPTGGGAGGGVGGGVGDDYTPEEVSVILFEIPIDVWSLKEFFEVKLHIINNASAEFSMLDNVVTLNVPEGLTIMDTLISEKEAVVKIAEIKGQTTETITWILRGDEVGEYYLSADYSGILSQFNAPIYTEFVAADPIEVYGLSNLKLYVEIPDILDNATLYYNVSLINEGSIDVYLPRINTEDILLEVELLDDRGREMLERLGLTARDFSTVDSEGETIEDWVTRLTGDVGVLKGGYAIRKHYMCLNQSSYSEKDYKLERYWYEMQNSYGLEVEIVVKPLSYFKSYLNSDVSSAEKAEQVLGVHKNVYDYLMNNQNFAYWALYSSNGALIHELPGTAEIMLWEMMNFDFVKMITAKESEALVKTLLLDAMEMSISSVSDYTTYLNAVGFLSKVTDFAQTASLEQIFGEATDELGRYIPGYFKYLYENGKWEFYRAVTGRYGDSEQYFYGYWEQYAKTASLDTTVTEAEFSALLHKLFSAEGFESVWSELSDMDSIIKDVLTVSAEVEMDISVFILAESNLANYNLFLDALISCAPAANGVRDMAGNGTGKAFLAAYAPWATVSSQLISKTQGQPIYGDADQVVRCAQEIKTQMNNGSALRGFLDKVLLYGAERFSDDAAGLYTEDAAEYAGIAGAGWFASLKISLDLEDYVGSNVFYAGQRHRVANNIRYISVVTMAMQEALVRAERAYRGDASAENAQSFMQLLYYLINIRAIGESQVAELGMSYAKDPVTFPEGYANPWDSDDLFKQVCAITDVADVKSWDEWRDVVEDELAVMRVQLFKNPVATEITGVYAPVVTFDYTKGETAQKFSDEYRYSIDGGLTWQQCDGGTIKIGVSAETIELMVERIDRTNTDQTGTGYCTIYGIPSLMNSGIIVVENAFGYLIDHLDKDKLYEITFSDTVMDYAYGDSLSIQVPAGSYSFLCQTDKTYKYVYIRSLSDASAYASYTLESAIVDYQSDWDVDLENGKITDLSSTSAQPLMDYCEKLRGDVKVTAPSGDEADKVGTGYILTLDDQAYEIVVSADVNGDAEINEDDLYEMLDHMNGEDELSGIYLEAGCMLGNEDIDIFDIFAALESVRAGEVTE